MASKSLILVTRTQQTFILVVLHSMLACIPLDISAEQIITTLFLFPESHSFIHGDETNCGAVCYHFL